MAGKLRAKRFVAAQDSLFHRIYLLVLRQRPGATMSFPRVSMRKLREILRLHFETDLKHRQIARSGSTSHVTVGKYVDAAPIVAGVGPDPRPTVRQGHDAATAVGGMPPG